MFIPMIVTVSVNEKPGLRAIANTAQDSPPVPGKHSGIGRDHEYKRLGMLDSVCPGRKSKIAFSGAERKSMPPRWLSGGKNSRP